MCRGCRHQTCEAVPGDSHENEASPPARGSTRCLMRGRRLVVASLFSLVGLVLSAHPASAQGAAGTPPIPPPRVKPEDPAITELKTTLDTVLKELADNKKALAELKTATDANKTAAGDAATTGKERGDTAWMLTASAFVLFM